MFTDGEKERTKNSNHDGKNSALLLIKVKEQRAEFNYLVTAIPCPFIHRIRKQNYKRKLTLETYQPTSPLFKEMFTSLV